MGIEDIGRLHEVQGFWDEQAAHTEETWLDRVSDIEAETACLQQELCLKYAELARLRDENRGLRAALQQARNELRRHRRADAWTRPACERTPWAR